MKKRWTLVIAIAMSLALSAVFSAGCDFGGDNNNQQNSEKPEFEFGIGTEENPYVISQPYQWTNINGHLSAYFELGADLNMGDIEDLVPIGSDETPFTGYLDGKNYKLHSASLKTSLFGAISGGTVKNLKFADSKIDSAKASLAETVKMGAAVENCHAENITMVSAKSASYSCAGLIKTVSSASTVRYCSANVVLTGNTNFDVSCVALVCEVSGGHIDACWASGTLKDEWYMSCSGLIGNISGGEVTNCYSDCTMLDFQNDAVSLCNKRTGGKMEYCLCFCDFSKCNAENNYSTKLFKSTSVTNESTLGYFAPTEIESSNDLLETAEWKDNKLWKKGKLHPELVSYEEYLQIAI